MALAFSHVTLGQRVLFGTGQAAANLAAEVERLAARSVMVIAAAAERAVTAPVSRRPCCLKRLPSTCRSRTPSGPGR